jgi:hypothetical protein
MFGFILLITIVDIVAVRHQLDDDHPFTTDMKKIKHDKFMLIPSMGFQNNSQFILQLNGWYYEPLKSSMRKVFE